MVGFRWAVVALVLCATVFGKQEFALHYLSCSYQLDELTATQNRLRTAFWDATEPPDKDQRDNEKKMLRWHKALLAKTEKLLIELGISYRAISLEDGTPALKVLPRKQGNKLNVFGGEVSDWLGTEFVYAPLLLQKENGKFSRARFNRTHNRILLSHEFVDGVTEDESLHHEILHAVFHWFRLHGVDSLFHGELKATDTDDDLWDGEHYQKRMSLEELATYPLNLRLFAKGLERLAAKGLFAGEIVESLLDEIERKADIYAELTGQTTDLLGEVIRETKAESGKVEISRGKVALAPMNGETRSVSRITFSVRHYQLRIPLLAGDRVTTAAVIKRLSTLHGITAQLFEQNKAVLRLVRAARKKTEGGKLDQATVDRLVAALKGPRDLTVPYLTSIDGVPSHEPEALKLPRPEAN